MAYLYLSAVLKYYAALSNIINKTYKYSYTNKNIKNTFSSNCASIMINNLYCQLLQFVIKK